MIQLPRKVTSIGRKQEISNLFLEEVEQFIKVNGGNIGPIRKQPH